jgi:hypothetical protein
MTAKLIFWELLCAALFWSVFCRSVRTDTTTRLNVRLALWLVGLASLLGLGAPLYGWQPDAVTIAIVLAVVCMQLVTATYWRRGVPERFVAGQFLKRNRRSGDGA